MDDFKVPLTIPQDLLLIQGFIDVPLPSNHENVSERVVEDDISSSGSEDDNVDSSEEEIAADLTRGDAAADGDEDTKTVDNTLEPSDSSSDLSSDSDSDSDSDSESSQIIEEGGKKPNKRHVLQDFHEDEDPLPVPSSGTYFTTKNEVTEEDVMAPEIDEVRLDERLEKVGEIMTIVDRIVIVRGLPSPHFNHASERALDSDTLLVFDDRKVLGYIYETFGPTMQPLYQVTFCGSFPLDPERVRVGREVFHVPSRSRFVFVSQIQSLRGSDASNVHDEEPGDDEVEFSDDEAETAYRNRLKRRRGDSRHRSAASSRSTTPNPTLMRDDELAALDESFMSGHAYDEHGPYDIDYASLTGAESSSRPVPAAYDDPYADSYNSPDVTEPEGPPSSNVSRANSSPIDHDRPLRGRRRGNRGRAYGERGHHGRGRARNAGQRYQTSPTISMSPDQSANYPTFHHGEYSPLYPEQDMLLPTPSQNSYPAYHHASQPQNYLQSFGVQPHINPRFASALGFSMYPPPSSAPQGYAGTQNYAGGQGTWTDEWDVPIQDNSQSGTGH